MNHYLKARINETVKSVTGFSEKLCTAKIAMNKATYEELTGDELTGNDYVTDAELTYLKHPTTKNWLKAMKSLNQNFVEAGRNAA